MSENGPTNMPENPKTPENSGVAVSGEPVTPSAFRTGDIKLERHISRSHQSVIEPLSTLRPRSQPPPRQKVPSAYNDHEFARPAKQWPQDLPSP